MIKKTLIFIALLYFYPSDPLYGNDESLKKTLVKKNKYFSQKFDNLAQELDTLLSNRGGVVPSKSRLSFIGFLESREGGVQSQSYHISADLRLPKLEKKWRLRFSSYDKEDEFEGLQRNRNGVAPRGEKYGASVGLVRNISNIETLFRPRIELKDPFVSSMLFKLKSNLEFAEVLVRWQIKFFAHSKDGVGQSVAVDFEKDLSKSLAFRFFNEQQYLDRDNLFSVAQGPSLLYKVNDSVGISSSFALSSMNRNIGTLFSNDAYSAESYHLASYRTDLSFMHKLFQNVFHYQITPFLEFQKQVNFKGSAGINLRTELIF